MRILTILILSLFSLVSFSQYIPDLDGKLPEIVSTNLQLKEISEVSVLNNSFESEPNFPLHDSTFGFFPRMGVVTINADADPDLEIVFNSYNKLYVINKDGSNVNGWPIEIPDPIIWSPSIGDIDGDQIDDIVFSAGVQNPNGSIYAYSIDGTVKQGFPFTDAGRYPILPILKDLDGDGADEIIYTKRGSSTEGYTGVLTGDGNFFPGWPILMDHYPASSCAAGDIDGDGIIEIVAESRNKLWVWDAAGNIKSGFPFDLDPTDVELNSFAAPLLVDIDGDDQHEIIFSSHQPGGFTYVLSNTGELRTGWPKSTPSWIYGAAITADINNDGNQEIFVPEYAGGNQQIYGYDVNGNLIPNFPIYVGNGVANQITLADLNADGNLELICDENVQDNLGQGQYLGFTLQADTITDFPLEIAGNSSFNQFVMEDLNGNGFYEIIGRGNDLVTTINHTQLWNSDFSYTSVNVINPYYQINKKHNGYIPLKPVATSMQPVNSSAIIQLFPNPVKNELTFRGNTRGSLQITNSLGEVVKVFNSSPVNVTDLSNGIYYISSIYDSKVSKAKFVKQ